MDRPAGRGGGWGRGWRREVHEDDRREIVVTACSEES